MDTVWQSFRTLVGEYFVHMMSSSHWFLLWMKLMGSHDELDCRLMWIHWEQFFTPRWLR